MSHEAALPPRPAQLRIRDGVASRSASDSISQPQGGRAGASDSAVARLAQFFPQATPVRIPVRVTDGGELSENTVIEFGTPREVLFTCTLPFEFADKVRLKNVDGSLDTWAFVVAVQYHAGKTAVAARFADELVNWIVKS
ncbi:MAG: hypothetical protein ACE14M_09405 [Terriglobales bacterium]